MAGTGRLGKGEHLRDVTLKDIAREADLSIAAVSKALAGSPHISAATRRRVRAISERLNYQPRRRRSAEGKPGRVGCLLIEIDRMARYATHWLNVLPQAATERALRLELGGIERLDEGDWREALQEHAAELDALLLVGCIKSSVLDAVDALNVPCVVIGDLESEHGTAPPAVHRVNTDKLAMSQFATRALIAQGHQRIAFFCGSHPPGGWNDQWLSGYRLALMRAGLSDDPALRPVLRDTAAPNIGVEAARYMAGLDHPPDAYVVPSVRGAARFRETMAEFGMELSPQQMVIGGSREEAAEYGLEHAPLVTEDINTMASRAVDLLARLAQGETLPPAQVVVPYQIHHLALPDASTMSQIAPAANASTHDRS